MPLPSLYLAAALRNVTPVCPEQKRLGVGFDIPGAAPMRLALTVADAQALANVLADYINCAAGTQSPISSLISSASMSVPSDGEKV